MLLAYMAQRLNRLATKWDAVRKEVKLQQS
jgi:hypothetical protein